MRFLNLLCLQVSPRPSTNPTSPRANVSTTTVPALDFPNLQNVPLPAGVSHQLFGNFFAMYRTHCLSVFNSISTNKLDEVIIPLTNSLTPFRTEDADSMPPPPHETLASTYRIYTTLKPRTISSNQKYDCVIHIHT
jgi:hypothetical protein